MPQTYEAGMPPVTLDNLYTIVIDVLDASGAHVSGCTLSDPVVFADVIGDVSLSAVGDPSTVYLLPVEQGPAVGAIGGAIGGALLGGTP